MSRLISYQGLSVLLLFAIIGVWVDPLYVILRLPDRINPEYTETGFEELRVIANLVKQADKERSSTIAARKSYVTYFAGRTGVPTPYADYESLIRYLSLNNVGFLVVEHRMLQGTPFLQEFTKGMAPSEFELLHRGVDSRGKKLELYRYHGPQRS